MLCCNNRFGIKTDGLDMLSTKIMLTGPSSVWLLKVYSTLHGERPRKKWWESVKKDTKILTCFERMHRFGRKWWRKFWKMTSKMRESVLWDKERCQPVFRLVCVQPNGSRQGARHHQQVSHSTNVDSPNCLPHWTSYPDDSRRPLQTHSPPHSVTPCCYKQNRHVNYMHVCKININSKWL